MAMLCFSGVSVFARGLDSNSIGEEKPGWFRRVFQHLDWEEIRMVVYDPDSASAAVRQNVRYQEDLGDTWSSGAETWARGSGDCEDMALTVVELVRHLGGEAEIVIFHPMNSAAGHAVAVGTWNGRQWISSNGFFYQVRSMEHAAELVAREMRWHNRTIAMVRGETEGEKGSLKGRRCECEKCKLKYRRLKWKHSMPGIALLSNLTQGQQPS